MVLKLKVCYAGRYLRLFHTTVSPELTLVIPNGLTCDWSMVKEQPITNIVSSLNACMQFGFGSCDRLNYLTNQVSPFGRMTRVRLGDTSVLTCAERVFTGGTYTKNCLRTLRFSF